MSPFLIRILAAYYMKLISFNWVRNDALLTRIVAGVFIYLFIYLLSSSNYRFSAGKCYQSELISRNVKYSAVP